MRCVRDGLMALAFCVAGLAAAPLAAQTPTPSGDTAASPQPQTRSFAAGQVRGELLTAPEGIALTAGGAVFAQIRLSTDVTARRGIAADLLIEAEQGEIAAVTGSGSKAENDGKAVRAEVRGLRRGRDRVLLIEVKLPDAETQRVGLKITLDTPAEDKKADAATPGQIATAEVSWTVKDCAGGYSQALQKLSEDPAGRLSQAWKEAAKADQALPKTWLFAPKQERRSRRRRRRSEPETTAASTSPDQRKIFSEAGRLIRARRDPALDRDGNLGWTLGKVASDLDNYVAQPSNPALCTGATGLADYYHKRLEGLTRRGEQLTDLAQQARLLAQSKVESALQTARELPEDSPGWNGVTPISVKAIAPREGLTGLTMSLAELAALPPEVLEKVKQAPTAYDALIQVADARFERDEMPETVRNQLRAAFAAIEAAARLEMARQRHMSIQSAFEARLKGIRDAHAAHCVCQS